MNKQESQRSFALWLWPAVLVVSGILLLLHNYLLFDFDILQFWPLLLVALGIQVLLRGDLGISWASQSFGITRGSVESGTLRANSGELDLSLNALQREGRLIAGQYTARSRPQLVADGNRAILTMLRGKTWSLSMADWQIGLATDLPWKLLISAYLGEIEADMRGLIIEQAHFATGIGDLRIVVPDSPAGHIIVRSTLGDIYLTVPDNMEASLTVNGSPFFGKPTESNRWRRVSDNQYVTQGYEEVIEPLELTVYGTFGDLILS